MRLNFTANSFVFGHINREIAPRSFYCKPCKRRTSRMRLNPAANSFTFGRKNRENASRTLFYKSCKEDFQNASELHSKPLRFWTHKTCNCAQNFFCETCRQRTSKMRLNFTANTFVFGRKNRENAPRTFLTCKVKTSKMRLDFTANSFVFARKNRENAPKTFL